MGSNAAEKEKVNKWIDFCNTKICPNLDLIYSQVFGHAMAKSKQFINAEE
jgi:hypothetical protein